ncbi:IscA/HesB family protein [Desulfovibrio sp. ZJ369]|uniref:IscA/HesB family protein n=1 Tax=Desulfovibrio sp. ZJ369 TaxID=2709793 RepID=UPI0013E9A370|nr:IscA/HesB family protein [Desulfovibrio sp. ZJ369]
MLELTESARKELEAYFADKEKSTIRIYLAPGGCSGPRLMLALDAATDQDQAEEQGGFTFCINKELLAQVQGVKIDLTYMGFAVEPAVPLPQSGGGCGGCCGGCGSK